MGDCQTRNRHTAGSMAIVAALLLGACGGGDDAAPPPASVGATIGAAGGTLDGPDGVRVEVPAGALTQDTVIRVAKTSTGAPGTLPAGVAAAPVYELTPHGINFNRPVTISLPTPAGDPAQRQVFMASPGDEGWRSVDSGSDGSRTAWQVLGFSWLFVGDACHPAAGDPSACQWPRSNGFFTATPSSALSFVDSDPVFAIKSYRLTAAGNVDVRFNYSGAADCAGTVGITRSQPGVRDAGGRVIVVSVLPTQAAVLTADPAIAGRGQGQTPARTIAFTSSDNGEHVFGMNFACVRGGQTLSVGGQLRLTVDIPVSTATAPAVTTQPASVSVQEPAAATFVVAAIGTPTPAVQWQRSDSGGAGWSDIPGATTPSFTTAATSVAGDNGSQFRAVLTNSQGSAQSQAAILTVTAAPPAAVAASVFVGSLSAAGFADGTGAAARLNSPVHITVDASGNAYFMDGGCALRKITAGGVVTTIAGTSSPNTFCSTSVDGTGAAARFNSPNGVAVDSHGNVFVAEGFGAIRKVTPAGVVSTFAGSNMGQGFADGQGAAALFSTPYGLAIDSSDNLYVADSGNGAIRKIDPAGNVSTVARGLARDAQFNQIPALDGPLGTATFMVPRALALDGTGAIYVSDFTAVRKIAGGMVSTVAGQLTWSPGYADGAGTAASFRNLMQIALDGAGNLFAADAGSHTVRKIVLANSAVSTVLGVDGTASTNPAASPPTVYPPYGVAVTAPHQLLVTASSVVLQVTVP